MSTKNKIPSPPFSVTVLINNLNIRETPNGKVTGTTGKGTFTIIETSNGWGKLKSGAGWIYLENPDYCIFNGTNSLDYSAIGKQLELCLNDIKNLSSYKKMIELMKG